MTGHAEVVRAVYDSAKVSYEDLLKVFWENHDHCNHGSNGLGRPVGLVRTSG